MYYRLSVSSNEALCKVLGVSGIATISAFPLCLVLCYTTVPLLSISVWANAYFVLLSFQLRALFYFVLNLNFGQTNVPTTHMRCSGGIKLFVFPGMKHSTCILIPLVFLFLVCAVPLVPQDQLS